MGAQRACCRRRVEEALNVRGCYEREGGNRRKVGNSATRSFTSPSRPSKVSSPSACLLVYLLRCLSDAERWTPSLFPPPRHAIQAAIRAIGACATHDSDIPPRHNYGCVCRSHSVRVFLFSVQLIPVLNLPVFTCLSLDASLAEMGAGWLQPRDDRRAQNPRFER